MAGHHKLDRTGQDEHNKTIQSKTEPYLMTAQDKAGQDKTNDITRQDKTTQDCL